MTRWIAAVTPAPQRFIHVLLVLVMAWLCFGFTSPHSSSI